jgi:hypothetical protein
MKLARLTALLLGCISFFFIASSAQAFNFLTPKYSWPGKPAVIKYHSNVKPYSWSVKQAVNAWNKSGIKVKFKKVSRAKKADLVIRQWKKKEPVNNCVGRGDIMGMATTQLTYTRSGKIRPVKSKVELNNYKGNPKECRFVMTDIVAHELAHVLGLDHTNKCATLGPTAILTNSWPPTYYPSACTRPPRPAWWCRILGKDDLKGAKKLYGGKMRLRSPQYCYFPSSLSASVVPYQASEDIHSEGESEEVHIDDGARFRFVKP